jgi:hypothetical protein
MTAFSFAIGGGGQIQIVEVTIPIPMKVETSPFGTSLGRTPFGIGTIKSDFGVVDKSPIINDNVISESFGATPKQIYFNVRN